MKAELVDVKKLKPAKWNPRLIKEKPFMKLCTAIADDPSFLWARPIAARKNGEVYGGNMRLIAVIELKKRKEKCKVAEFENWSKIPAVLSKITLKEAKVRAMRDNGHFGEWEDDSLAELINELDGMGVDLESLGMQEKELQSILTDLQMEDIEEDETPELPVKAKSKIGELYELGDHRLMCGDANKKKDVERLMYGKKADMVFTDPPYGMDLDTDYNSYQSKDSPKAIKNKLKAIKHDKIIGDNKEFDFLTAYELFEYVKEQFWWGADYYCDKLPKGGSWIVWDKTGGHDSLMKAGFGSNFELCWSKKKHKRDIARITRKGISGHNDGKRVHPTMKPIALTKWFFERWGKNGDLVIDCFGGSGTTLLVCQQMKRKCYMMELDPKYIDVIIKRWENLTGKKAKKI